MPATSQLDWLISITAISVLFSSRAASDRLSACPGAGRGRLNSAAAWGTSSVLLQRRWCHSLAARPIASLVEAGRQDVLEEAPDELVAGHGFLALAVGGAVLVAIAHGLVVDGQDAVVGDGDAEGA